MSLPDRSLPPDASAGPPIAKVATGVRGLDTALKGGLPVGRTILLSGGPGTGKTVLATELLWRRALAGEPGVFVSFEERAEDLRANAAAMGMDIAALEQAGQLSVVHVEVPHGAIRSGEFDIRGLLAFIEGHTRAVGATRIVLDALDVLMRIFGDPLREREEMYVLHQWLRERGLSVILTVKANPSGQQIYPFLDFMADCVLSLDQRMAGQVRTRRLTVLKFRGSDFLSNEHPYLLTSSGVVLMPVSSMDLAYEPSRIHISSGNDQLDAILGGGFLRGTSIVLAGATGTGKTTMVSTFTREVCRKGEKALYVGFEESREALVSEMLAVGIDLRPALETGALTVLTAFPESAGVEQHLLRVLDAVEELEPSHLVVDAISACRRMGSEHAAFDFLVRLITACREKGVTCIYTNQLARAERATEITGFDISSLADTLMLLEYVDDGRKLSRRLLVIKARGAKHSMRYHELRITEHGFSIDSSVPEPTQEGAEE